MKKVLFVAGREFTTTVMTRGFMIGLLLMPAIMALLFIAMPRLMSQRLRPVEGIVGISDPTGQVVERLQTALDPRALAARRSASASEALPAALRNMGLANLSAVQVRERTLAEAPVLHLVPVPGDASAIRDWLLDGSPSNRRLAVVAIHPDAITQPDGSGSNYDVYVAPRVDSRVEPTLYDGVRDALISARSAAAGIDRARFEPLLHVSRPQSVTVGVTGNHPTDSDFAQALPFVFVAFMVAGVMVGGQGMMTSTIEEKANRVVEVLLSAVSPIELMAGKILGQFAVSALTLAVYIALGMTALWSLAMTGLVSPLLIVYFVIFYVLAYMIFGSVMAAIGAAVNEMREAQSLMMPVMLSIMVPWILAAPILRNPSSTFATVISLIPPMSTFAMLMRLTSVAPPPAWQIALSMVLSLGAVVAAVWFASKVFRVGLLMFGKPPDFATLIRWVRMA